MFEQIDQLIATSDRLKVILGREVPQELIEDAQRELGLGLPETYKAWLQLYGNLFIGDSQVFTLAAVEDRDIADEDLIYNARLASENGFPPPGLLPLYEPGADEAFYFDTREGLVSGEYPVIRFDHSDGSFQPYASSFLQFLATLVRAHA